MRRVAAVALLLLAACRDEPDFEERYAETQERVEATAEGIQTDLEAGLQDDAQGEAEDQV